MGIARSRHDVETDMHFIVPKEGERCFDCCKELEEFDRPVYWMGVAYDIDTEGSERSTIWLHPACAVRLAMNLIKDAIMASKFDIVERPRIKGKTDGR